MDFHSLLVAIGKEGEPARLGLIGGAE